jgi:cobalt/nickel transport system permease protein
VLGLNIVNAALVPAFIGWPILRAFQRIMRAAQGESTAGGLAVACAVAAYVNVLLAACLFVLEFHLGHKGSVEIGPVVGGTIGVYAFVGIVEAIVTAGIVRALLARRPDLVMIAPPELRRSVRRRARPRPAIAGAGGTAGARGAAGVASGTVAERPATWPPPPPGCEPEPVRRTRRAGARVPAAEMPAPPLHASTDDVRRPPA